MHLTTLCILFNTGYLYDCMVLCVAEKTLRRERHKRPCRKAEMDTLGEPRSVCFKASYVLVHYAIIIYILRYSSFLSQTQLKLNFVMTWYLHLVSLVNILSNQYRIISFPSRFPNTFCELIF